MRLKRLTKIGVKEIKKEYKLYTIYQNSDFKLVGMPFYNEESRKKEFNEKFEEVLNLNT